MHQLTICFYKRKPVASAAVYKMVLRMETISLCTSLEYGFTRENQSPVHDLEYGFTRETQSPVHHFGMWRYNRKPVASASVFEDVFLREPVANAPVSNMSLLAKTSRLCTGLNQNAGLHREQHELRLNVRVFVPACVWADEHEFEIVSTHVWLRRRCGASCSLSVLRP